MEDTFTILTPLLAVAVVIAGAYWTAKWVARHNNAYSSGRHIQVVERVMLAKDAYLALIRVAGKTHLASVSSGKVELLREVDPEELKMTEMKKNGGDFFGLLTKALTKGKQMPENKESGGQDGLSQ